MFGRIVRCSVLCILFLGIVGGSPISEESIRRAKADEIMKYMNVSADPCEDFYAFVCGNFARFNPASKYVLHTGVMKKMLKEMQHTIQSLLETDEANDTETDKQVKTFYRSCMNLPSLKDTYADKLKGIVEEFGQMPALVGDTWQEENFDWLRTVGNIAHKLGIGILNVFAVAVDFADSSVNRLYITQQDFPLMAKAIYLGKEHKFFVNKYKLGIARKLEDFLRLEENLALTSAKEIVDFESSLARGMFDVESGAQMNDIYKASTLDEAQQQYSADMDIKQQASIALGSIPANLKVYIQQDYQQNLLKVVANTPKKVVANYIFYTLLDYFIFDMPETEEQLQETCLEDMKPYFRKHMDNMVYRKYHTKDTDDAIDEMWQTIKSTFHKSLESEDLNWIKEDTRKQAVEKLNAMTAEILSYESYNFTKYYGQLRLDSENYIGNMIQVLSAKAIQTIALINDPPQPADFGEMKSVTPVHNLLENSVKIPASYLQPHYTWSSSFPNAFNYAVLGGMLSHELLHGFDATGRTYDNRGNNRVWWNNESNAEFDDGTKCFRAQYKEYIFGGRRLPEMTDQGENLADNGGVRLAYQAYLNWSENLADNGGVRLAYQAYLNWHENTTASSRKTDLESWSGLNYNNKQLFFISYGHIWCSDSSSVLKSALASDNHHVPDHFRVIGPLSNFEEFSKVFNCPSGSGMNPAKKCQIY